MVNNLKLFPNPSNGDFTIQSSDEMIGANVSIYTILGQNIKSFELNSTNFKNTLNNGIYFVEIMQGDEMHVVKLVKIAN